MPYPPPPEPNESPYEPAPAEEIVERTHPRIRIVRTVNALIHLVCAVFALVLAIHIVLVLGEANMANGFAHMINEWSSGVSLGLRNLFTPDSAKFATFLNDGLAAVIWLVIGAILTDVITRIGVPGPKRVWYRRRSYYG
ncbi:Uncharacterised protein [Amycolatopsis camponoti]|uniref:Uncharacterized protein n=1 Tax=Amycolatopsis camponoti TaxID=2606593 RepID=A0A6I8LRH4_9PSEU|nr:hypothetical protein [Amycolatopsis camponoti]VVJ20484.1 Uncharacterised protein [Amycolatopsis camponoti]